MINPFKLLTACALYFALAVIIATAALCYSVVVLIQILLRAFSK